MFCEDLKIIDVRWSATPRVAQRNISKDIAKDNPELKKDIEKKPYVILTDTSLIIKFSYKGVEYIKEEVIEKGWTYNYANIPWFVEPITYDKHSPYMKISSLAHDRVLDFRWRLWFEWDLDKIFNNKLSLFRELTSMIFEYLCVDAGVPKAKARIMSISVDVFQAMSIFDWGRWKFDKYKKGHRI